jgi:hypothetical protein
MAPEYAPYVKSLKMKHGLLKIFRGESVEKLACGKG